MNYYDVLGVSPNASDEEIRKAYHDLLIAFHPDNYRGKKEFAEKKTIEIREAYTVLSNSAKRMEYDKSITPNTDRTEYSRSENTQYSRKNSHLGIILAAIVVIIVGFFILGGNKKHASPEIDQGNEELIGESGYSTVGSASGVTVEDITGTTGFIEVPYQKWIIEEEIFESPSLGVAFELPDGWRFCDEEELCIADGLPAEEDFWRKLEEDIDRPVWRTEMFALYDKYQVCSLRIYKSGILDEAEIAKIHDYFHNRYYEKDENGYVRGREADSYVITSQKSSIASHDADMYSEVATYDDNTLYETTWVFYNNGFLGTFTIDNYGTSPMLDIAEHLISLNSDRSSDVSKTPEAISDTSFSDNLLIDAESGWIKGYYYNEDSKELYVRLRNGLLYVYYDIPKSTANTFASIESKQEYLYTEIREQFEFEIVEEGPEDYEFNVLEGPAGAKYVVDTYNGVIHKLRCDNLTNGNNNRYTDTSYAELVYMKYKPCEKCLSVYN